MESNPIGGEDLAAPNSPTASSAPPEPTVAEAANPQQVSDGVAPLAAESIAAAPLAVAPAAAVEGQPAPPAPAAVATPPVTPPAAPEADGMPARWASPTESEAADPLPLSPPVAAAPGVPTPLPVPPPLPPPASRQPPRPLVAGAFLHSEIEIKAVLARGLTNLYSAAAGDYGDTMPKLVAEREAPPTSEAGAPPVAPASPPAAEVPAAEAAPSATVPALLPASEAFAVDDREYLVFDYVETKPLQDYREGLNDERLLAMLSTLVHGLASLEAKGLTAELSTETLRVDAAGELRFFGFSSAPAPGLAALEQLRTTVDFLLKHVFADSSTMRLDDRYAGMALTDEVKLLARRIDGDGPEPYASIAEVAAAVDALYAPGRRLSADAALLSDVGQERELNEDAGLIVRTQRSAHLGSRAFDLYVVSDGMGGHEGGEVASDLTLSSLQRHLDALQIDWNDSLAIRTALYAVIDEVNADVVALTETAKYRGTRAKPGATLTFALRLGNRLFVCNVGDSRTYKFTEAQGLQRISKDHSYVQGLVDRGDITEDEAWDHPEGSIITAHIGYPRLKTRDVFLRWCAPGDTLLLVSDGVVDMLRDRDIEAALRAAAAAGEDSAAVCQHLVDGANAAGGFDNITALCVKLS